MKKKKMGRGAVVILPVLAAAFLGAGCSPEKAQQEETVSVVADGVLTVGILDGQDPYARKEGSEFVGMEPEIFRILAENLGVTVEYRQAEDVSQLMALLDDGAVDLAAGRLTMTETYRDTHLASRSYGKQGLYLITRRNRYVDNLAGYSDGTVGLSWQIPGFEALNIPFIGELGRQTYGDVGQIPEDVKEGVILAGICTEREALGLLGRDQEIQAMELREGPRISQVFYTAPGQETFVASLNQAINTFLDQQAQEE